MKKKERSLSMFLLKRLALPTCLFFTISSEAQLFSIQSSPRLISVKQWQESQERPGLVHDTVLLYNGNEMNGKLERIPALDYSFGIVDLHIEDLAIIHFFEENNRLKAQVITMDGENYVSSVKDGDLEFTRPNEEASIKMDPRLVNFIILGEKKDRHQGVNHRLYSLQFKNGDHLPIAPVDESIRLAKGRQEFNLPIKRIVDVTYNGGIEGIVENEEGNISHLDFAFIKDKYFCFNLTGSNITLKMPWDKIAHIQGRNHGFKRENIFTADEDKTGNSEELIAFEPEAFSAFMQPFPLKKMEIQGTPGVSAVSKKIFSSLDDQQLGMAGSSTFFTRLDFDFDSPFNIAFELEGLTAAMNSGVFEEDPLTMMTEIYLDSSLAGVNQRNEKTYFRHNEESFEFFAFESSEYPGIDYKGQNEIAMLSKSEIIKINDDLIFDQQKFIDVDPESFNYKEIKMTYDEGLETEQLNTDPLISTFYRKAFTQNIMNYLANQKMSEENTFLVFRIPMNIPEMNRNNSE